MEIHEKLFKWIFWSFIKPYNAVAAGEVATYHCRPCLTPRLCEYAYSYEAYDAATVDAGYKLQSKFAALLLFAGYNKMNVSIQRLQPALVDHAPHIF